MPDDAPTPALPTRTRAASPRNAASLIVVRLHPDMRMRLHPDMGTRLHPDGPEILMGLRGARHRFMPNRLVFPGGRVDRLDARAPCAAELSPKTAWALARKAGPRLAHALAAAAARELREETGLTLGDPPRLDVLHYLARAVTPPSSPIRFNARFLVVDAAHVSGELGGDGELEALRFYSMQEALALDLALVTRLVLERLRLWLSMTESERDAITETPVLLRDRGWAME